MGMTPGPEAALLARVERWMADDPDGADRAELAALVAAADIAGLAERFGGGLRFGTAGLRAPLGAGPGRMNRATVRQASAGLGAYLLAEVPAAAERGVVVGRDARHGSAALAEETAAVLAGAGLRVLAVRDVVPTPVLAFAVRHHGAAAGVMITASHNPGADNGYKVYWGDGAQIVPPVDAGIAAAMAEVGPLAAVPVAGPTGTLGDELVDAYLDAVVPAALHGAAREVRVAYTPMHGVGGDVLRRAFARAGFAPPAVVAAQGAPDPDFPTVARPNPEEPGALDLLVAEATAVGADVALANDPDADRLGVAIPDGDGWRRLHGDEIGGLLADHLLGHTPDVSGCVLAASVASSTLLARMAEATGATFVATLTGFKWIARAAGPGGDRRLLLGYEEALGYAVTDVVADKDGISAALALAELAAETRAAGASLTGRLDDIARRYGLHATDQWTIALPAGGEGVGEVDRVMAALRDAPPAELLGCPVVAVDDLATGWRRRPDGTREPVGLPPSDVVVWHARDATRVVVRPSGTEPKLKVYLQVVVPVGADGDVGSARATAGARLGRLCDEVREVMLR
jgi:phosphomannomutase